MKNLSSFQIFFSLLACSFAVQSFEMANRNKYLYSSPFYQATELIPYDANCDGFVDILDIITMANYIMNLNPEPFCFENADINGDGEITVVDVIGTVNIIMGKSGQQNPLK